MKKETLLIMAMPIFFKTNTLKALFMALLTTFYLQASAQNKLYNPTQAKREANYLANEKSKSSQSQEQTDSPEYNIHQTGDLTMITFNKNSNTSEKNFFEKFKKVLQMGVADDFRFISSQIDNNGVTHYRYDQFYKGIPIIGGQFALHERNGKLIFASGKFYKGLSLSVIPKISKEKAIEKGLTFVGAKMYMWENSNAENALKKQENNPNASFFPKPKLVIAPKDGVYSLANFRLSYKVNINAELPNQNLDIYVDANTEEIINKVSKIAHADVAGVKARTAYSGLQTITTDSYNGSFRLEETSQRPIQTFNMLNGTDYSKAIDFTNKSNKSWGSEAIKLTNVTINKINNSFIDLEDRGAGDADIFIEIRDINNRLIFGKSDAYYANSNPNKVAISISIDNIPLMKGNYTLYVYDYDLFSPNDLLGKVSIDLLFDDASGTVNLSDGGTIVNVKGTKSYTTALDAHWGIEKTFDYYLSEYGRRSYDGNGGLIKVYLHPNASLLPKGNPNNAFWSSSMKAMVFGDGDEVQMRQLAALDVCGHELTHAYIDYNSQGGLPYQGESGALNESFADIFGTAVEFYSLPSGANWTIAEGAFIQAGQFLRSLSDPKAKGQPNTYLTGTHWYAGPDDDGGVHTNSGVQNFWFYLLCNGKKGINDNVDEYDVPAIGMSNAAKIAYDNMIYYLGPNATYNDAYEHSLVGALIYFSRISREYRAIREAWYAVGVAKKPFIDFFTPTSGSAGTSVTIKGEGFLGTSFVEFNGLDAPDFTVVDDNTITVIVPQGDTKGKIKVTAGYQSDESDDDFNACTSLNVDVTSTDATTFALIATGGSGNYEYSLDNVTFQTSNEFTNLTPGQTYTAYVKDDGGCTGQKQFSVNPQLQCNVQSGSGGVGTSFTTQLLGTTAGRVDIAYEMYGIPDQMDVYYNGVLVASTGGLVSGGSILTFNYNPPAGGPYFCTIRMYAPNNGTAWDFIAYCPIPTSSVTSKNSAQDYKNETAEVAGLQTTRTKNTSTEKENLKTFAINLFPNPSKNFFTLTLISGNYRQQISLRVFDISGKVKETRNNLQPDQTFKLGENYIPGIYLVEVIQGNQRKTLKLIKQ